MKTKQKPISVKIASTLFILIGVIWIIISVFTIIRAEDNQSLPLVFFWILSVMMVGNGLLLAGTSWGIYHQKRVFYWVGLLLLILNIVLTFTDQFGLMD